MLSTVKPDIDIALRFALRESRGGFRSMRLMLFALMIGMAIITTIGVLREGLLNGVTQNARAIMGGDVQLSRPYRALEPAEREALETLGAVSGVMEMRAMAAAVGDAKNKNKSAVGDAQDNKNTAAGDTQKRTKGKAAGKKDNKAPAAEEGSEGEGEGARNRLVELKGVDLNYPLYGALVLEPDMLLSEAFAERKGRHGIVVDASVLPILQVAVGDVLSIGKAKFDVRAVIAREPDRLATTFRLGPRVLTSREAFLATGLVTDGSLVQYRYHLKLMDGEDTDGAVAAIKEKLPAAGWRIQDYRDAAPRLKEMLERLQRYINLIGIAVLIIAGIGMASAVQNWLLRKQETIATLKCIGATRLHMYLTYGFQLLFATLAAMVAGIALGWVLPRAIAAWCGDLLPVAPVWGGHLLVSAQAALFGLALVATFSFWPLMTASNTRPALIFRALGFHMDRRMMTPWHLAVYAVMILMLVAAACFIVGDVALTLVFTGGMLLAIAVLVGVALGFEWLAGRLRARGNLPWRHAMANISRVNAPSMSIVIAFGMGTALVIAVMLAEHSLSRQLDLGAHEDAPDFFFMDIQQRQMGDFSTALEKLAGTERFIHYPVVRGRVTSLQGLEASEAMIAPSARWAVQGDRMLSFSDKAPEHNPLLAGVWWAPDYEGDPLVSVSQDLAEGMRLAVGDSIGFEVMGKTIEAKVASIRKVDWRSYRMNFAFIFSPGVLEEFPYTYLATLESHISVEPEVLRIISDKFANVSMVRLRDALDDARDLMQSVAGAVRLVAMFAFVMGVLVMVTAVSATQARRTLEHTIFKVLGATRRHMLMMLGLEYVYLGAVAAVAACALGVAAASLLTSQALNIAFDADAGLVVMTSLLAVAAMTVVGVFFAWCSFRIRPIDVLRNE